MLEALGPGSVQLQSPCYVPLGLCAHIQPKHELQPYADSFPELESSFLFSRLTPPPTPILSRSLLPLPYSTAQTELSLGQITERKEGQEEGRRERRKEERERKEREKKRKEKEKRILDFSHTLHRPQGPLFWFLLPEK